MADWIRVAECDLGLSRSAPQNVRQPMGRDREFWRCKLIVLLTDTLYSARFNNLVSRMCLYTIVWRWLDGWIDRAKKPTRLERKGRSGRMRGTSTKVSSCIHYFIQLKILCLWFGTAQSLKPSRSGFPMRQDAPSLRPMFSLVFPLFLFFISSSSYSYKIIITHHHSYTLTIHPSTPVFGISLAAFDVELFRFSCLSYRTSHHHEWQQHRHQRHRKYWKQKRKQPRDPRSRLVGYRAF